MSIKRDPGGHTLTISDSAAILDDCHLGDSIAVNGACLTVTQFHPVQDGGYFTVFLTNETLARTEHGTFIFLVLNMSNLTYLTGNREVGEQVNLERAMATNARFGGHFVQVRRMSNDAGLAFALRCGYRAMSTPQRPSLTGRLTANHCECGSVSQSRHQTDHPCCRT